MDELEDVMLSEISTLSLALVYTNSFNPYNNPADGCILLISLFHKQDN
jgi:hypothetical protein